MKIDLKAVLLGVLMVIALSIFMTFLLSSQLTAIYSHSISSKASSLLTLFASAVMSFFLFGVSGYLAAALARRALILNALVVGVVGSAALTALSWTDAVERPLFTSLTCAFSISAATLAGVLREHRLGKSEK
jgi:hypothetical protein